MKNEPCKVTRWQLLKRELHNLAPREFKEAVEKDPSAVVLDVRTSAEYAQGGLLKARNISYLSSDLWDQLELLDRDRSYYVYCRTGRRSIRVCTLMKNGGFRKVYNLDGGMLTWEQVFPGMLTGG